MAHPLNPTLAALLCYPESNPYHATPPVHNLIPKHYEGLEFDTPELKAAAFAIARKHYINVFAVMYGTNPFLIAEEELYDVPLPITNYTAPPTLHEAVLDDNLVLLEQINPLGNVPLFKIDVGGKEMLLKIANREPDRNFEPRRYNSELEEPDYPSLFEREKEAYAHLLHHGVCQKGVVPNCFGWTRLTADHLTCIQNFAGLDGVATTLEDDERPPTGILLEYLEDAERVSLENVTEEVAEKALRGLCDVHAAYVSHGDVHRRNVLVLPDGRVAWIDFDNSACASDSRIWRQHFIEELKRCWGYFYGQLLSDKRIGYRDPWY
ncbi:hypothetical protein PHLGIDRAFT_36520 [Phlebiopsis gigantea 11061_1 CR5-6]|uniref:Aminoglycoside phosphotransferase domain-containing protein n=1 Tax=Phlebiopsis gigantea (strain 11061_1 CR5-6) TaxID=745531 RepID=A0A0C3S4W1_PHLG1|nr:hypothetical protein PHLGIDRAFT_36520 [Phlebiopsis gigantea 11061_1 CR5-6]